MLKNDFKSPELSSVSEEVNKPKVPSALDLSLSFNELTLISPDEITSTDQVLGSGEFSQVRTGTWNKSGDTQPVALKIFYKNYHDVIGTETTALIRLKEKDPHPHIAQVYGQINTPNQKALVMEMIEGTTLKSWLKDTPRETSECSQLAYQFALDCLNGLVFLHSLNIVHMDIKPDNIMIHDGRMAKIIDFNTACVMPMDAESMLVENTGGTLMYAPVEKLVVKEKDKGLCEISTKTDIYSYAFLLYFCASMSGHELTHMRRMSSAAAKQYIVANRLPPIPKAIPENTQKLMVMCWSRNQFERPSSAEAFQILSKEVQEKRFTIK